MSEQNKKITPALPRGMRDYLPEQMKVRQKVVETLREVFELYGYQPLETPAMERLEILSGKYGEEGENLSFRVLKRGEELERALNKVKTGEASALELCDLGLRYDLTVPLARVVAMYRDKLPMPFKRYQIGPVWRAERPQHGRYREFTQCDADIVGTDSPVADIEIISLLHDGGEAIKKTFELKDLNLVVKVNHRGVLKQWSALLGNRPDQFEDFCIALDKYDKVGKVGVIEEMKSRALRTEKMDKFWDICEETNEEQNWDEISSFFERELAHDFEPQHFTNLRKIIWHEDLIDRNIQRDFTLARGLAYYTGAIFELVATGKDIGSLGGGGRYDGLIGLFSRQPIPAVGASFGIDRIVDVILSQEDYTTSKTYAVEVVIIEKDPDKWVSNFSGWIINTLRNNGISCERSYKSEDKLGKMLESANKRGALFVVILDEELRKDSTLLKPYEKEPYSKAEFIVKCLYTGEQRRLKMNEAINWIKAK